MNRVINQVNYSIKSPFHDNNEDGVLIVESDKYSLYFVFDGVGSASHAIEAVAISSKFISDNYKKYEQGEKFDLSKLMYHTHLQILDSKLPEALTTYVVMFVPYKRGQEISISSMGDSRIYGISKENIIQHTKDDNLPNVEDFITKSLGMLKIKDTDFIQKNFIPKENRYVVCSDGFYELIDKDVENFSKTFNISKLTDVKEKLEKDIVGNNKDDASYILIEIH